MLGARRGEKENKLLTHLGDGHQQNPIVCDMLQFGSQPAIAGMQQCTVSLAWQALLPDCWFSLFTPGHPGDGRKRVHWETTGHPIDP